MLYTFGTRLAAAAHRQTIAAILAQQRIEELVGLTEAELLNEEAVTKTEKGLDVTVSVADPAVDQADFMNQLAEVTVQVDYNVADGPLVEHTVVISLANPTGP
jgi:hypothetical protein